MIVNKIGKMFYMRVKDKMLGPILSLKMRFQA